MGVSISLVVLGVNCRLLSNFDRSHSSSLPCSWTECGQVSRHVNMCGFSNGNSPNLTALGVAFLPVYATVVLNLGVAIIGFATVAIASVLALS